MSALILPRVNPALLKTGAKSVFHIPRLFKIYEGRLKTKDIKIYFRGPSKMGLALFLSSKMFRIIDPRLELTSHF
jgi:hypothetical protein